MTKPVLTIATIDFNEQNVQEVLGSTPVAATGRPNLRAIAGELGIASRGVGREQLVAAISTAIVEKLEAMRPAIPVGTSARWSNRTIRPDGDTTAAVDNVWALLSHPDGVSITDLAKAMGLNRTTVAGRLFTLSGNGLVIHTNRPDAMNRPVAYYRATATFSKDVMARKLLKVLPPAKAPALAADEVPAESAAEVAPVDEAATT